MKYTFSANDKLSDALRAYADANLLDVQDAIRSILTLHLTGRCGVAPQPAAQAPQATTAQEMPRPKTATKMIEEMKALTDPELLVRLEEVGFAPKDGESLVLPGDLHDKRYWKMEVRTDAQGRMVWNTIRKPGDPAYREMSNPCYQDEAAMWSAILKHLRASKRAV